jgi:hypothetical protein
MAEAELEGVSPSSDEGMSPVEVRHGPIARTCADTVMCS